MTLSRPLSALLGGLTGLALLIPGCGHSPPSADVEVCVATQRALSGLAGDSYVTNLAQVAAAATRSTRPSLRNAAYLFARNTPDSFGPQGLASVKSQCATMGHPLDDPKNL